MRITNYQAAWLRSEYHAWVLSACSFSPYTADWWECALDINDHLAIASPKWKNGVHPAVVTHKELARNVSNIASASASDWSWKLYYDYKAKFVLRAQFFFTLVQKLFHQSSASGIY